MNMCLPHIVCVLHSFSLPDGELFKSSWESGELTVGRELVCGEKAFRGKRHCGRTQKVYQFYTSETEYSKTIEQNMKILLR